MPPVITVDVVDDRSDPVRFSVRVAEGRGESRHEVTASKSDLARLAKAGEPAADFVRRCFEFLLAREPKESILSRFDVSVIGKYFPEFEREIVR